MKWKRGDAVWTFYEGDKTGYPGMHHLPAIVQKRLHPTCYVVRRARPHYYENRNEPRKWKLSDKTQRLHPDDMCDYKDAAAVILQRKIKAWRERQTPEVLAEHDERQASMKRAQQVMQRELSKIFSGR